MAALDLIVLLPAPILGRLFLRLVPEEPFRMESIRLVRERRSKAVLFAALAPENALDLEAIVLFAFFDRARGGCGHILPSFSLGRFSLPWAPARVRENNAVGPIAEA